MEQGARILVLAPVVNEKKGQFEHIPGEYQRSGFARARVDGVVYSLDEWPSSKKFKHTIEIVVDRLTNDEANQGRLAQSIEQALEIGNESIIIHNVESKKDQLLSQRYACPIIQNSLCRNLSREYLALMRRKVLVLRAQDLALDLKLILSLLSQMVI